jgi:peptidoglycan/xylan/chitin deacetylase (PgdA/CDA1 family)
MRLRRPLSMWSVPPWQSRDAAPRPLILLYHAVAKVPTDPWGVRVTPRNFAEHMAVLRAHTNPLSLGDLGEALKGNCVPDRCVVVTFDDGYADNLIHAKPAMEQHRVPATVFVASGYVGSNREYWWDLLDAILLQPNHLPETLKLTVGGKSYEWSLGSSARYGVVDAFKTRRWRAWQEECPTPRHHVFRTIWHLLRVSTTEDRNRALEEMRQWADVGEEAGQRTFAARPSNSAGSAKATCWRSARIR